MPEHAYESVGDGNIGVEAEVIPPRSANNDSVGYETSIPIHPQILAPLSYLLGLLSGIVIVILEKRNTYVRLHAWQSIILSLLVTLGSLLLFWIPPIAGLIHLTGFFAAVLCMFRAWKDTDTLTFFKLGPIGDFAERQVLGSTVLPF
ncbi:hypothetical protein EC988_001047 [Linderina pennispora]|nr:hypothetical protein EC988_001047 [Linderina pennispora]